MATREVTAEDAEPRVHRLAAAASLLGVAERTLRSLVAEGEIPVVRLSAGRVGISNADLVAFVRRRRSVRGAR